MEKMETKENICTFEENGYIHINRKDDYFADLEKRLNEFMHAN